jgi:two-component system, NarL family, nitrate/nitrite response regulator NarL
MIAVWTTQSFESNWQYFGQRAGIHYRAAIRWAERNNRGMRNGVMNGVMKEQMDEIRIRLVLLQEQGLLRASLARFLASVPEVDVIGECSSSSEALAMLAERPADLVLSDFDLGADAVATLISSARAAGYHGRFLLIAGATEADSVALAIKLGAAGIFLKSERPEQLVEAIRLVAGGGMWIDPSVVQLLATQCVERPGRYADPNTGKSLDDRQRRVILGILSGLTNRKIGKDMGLSEGTVKNIVQGLFSRTGVRTRSQLVRLALEGSLGSFGPAVGMNVSLSPAAGCGRSEDVAGIPAAR